MKQWIGRGILLVVLIAGGMWAWTNKDQFLNPEPFEKGKCTWYVYQKAKKAGWKLEFNQIVGLQAKMWPERTKNGTMVMEPEAGAVAIFDSWSGNSFGHVGYVESADATGFTMSFVDFPAGTKSASLDGVEVKRAHVTVSEDQARIEGFSQPLTLVGYMKKK